MSSSTRQQKRTDLKPTPGAQARIFDKNTPKHPRDLVHELGEPRTVFNIHKENWETQNIVDSRMVIVGQSRQP
jgi:hypothetical protein